jgi:hypothetical protein
MVMPLVLDVDTGIDDALALLLACASSEVELVAVTCIGGNVDARQVAENTLAVLELAGRADVPVYLGSEKPLRKALTTSPETHGPRYYAGARFFAETNTFDSLGLPKRGVGLHVSADSRYDVGSGTRLSTNYKLAGALAVPFDRGERFVLITRAQVEGIVGEHAFYFAPTLGGEGQLRAYHREQFAGDLAVSHSSDLRIDVWRIQTVMPGTVASSRCSTLAPVWRFDASTFMDDTAPVISDRRCSV